MQEDIHWKYTRIDECKYTRNELHQTLNSSSGHQFSSSTASAIHSRKREVAREAQSPKTRGKTANTNKKTESTQSTCVTWYKYKYNVAREVKSKCRPPCSWQGKQGGQSAYWPSGSGTEALQTAHTEKTQPTNNTWCKAARETNNFNSKMQNRQQPKRNTCYWVVNHHTTHRKKAISLSE